MRSLIVMTGSPRTGGPRRKRSAWRASAAPRVHVALAQHVLLTHARVPRTRALGCCVRRARTRSLSRPDRSDTHARDAESLAASAQCVNARRRFLVQTLSL